MPSLITRAQSNEMSDGTSTTYINTQKCIAGCKLSAHIRERRHLQAPAVPEVERLQRRQLADCLGQRLQPSLMDPKILSQILSRTSRETPPKKKK